ncbi:MAG: TAXI family TRAP transporter solute-binding subunit [Alphaproteobacteria bacterium]|nr:TAXI family TRAP transporter solute-binding subunit [Alphaproteobacteria bacterium]
MPHWLVLFFIMFLPLQAQAAEPLTMVTGPKTGTYYAIGQDIAKALDAEGMEISIRESEGSIDNIKRMNDMQGAMLGMVQSDVLGFLSRSQTPESLRMASRLRMVLPLHEEEVHVLARRSIENWQGLQGKRVAIGEEASGNMLTAINLFALSELEPAEMKKMPPAEGVVAVLKGELDAVIFVGGKPVRLFKNLENLTDSQNQKFTGLLSQVHFLPLDNARLLEEYRPATITAQDYSFVSSPVPTVAVQAVLVSFDVSASKERCKQLGAFTAALRDKLSELKNKGHSKWNDVDVDNSGGLWKKDACAWPDTPASPVDDKKQLLNILEKRG